MLMRAVARCLWLPILSLPLVLAGEAESGLVGAWLGSVELRDGRRLRLAFRVEGQDGSLTALMDSVDEGLTDIAVASVTLQASRVRFFVPAFGGRFQGRLDSAKGRIVGVWLQGSERFWLVLARCAEVPRPPRPQNPVGPFDYRVVEVAFSHAPGRAASFLPRATPRDSARISLFGSLSLPPGAGPHPAVVLISGSGNNDRDHTIAGHRPFAVMADNLCRAGLAVLRFDDRGAGESTGRGFPDSTTRDFADDARAAVSALRARAEVDAERIGLIGHSEGALIAAMVAADDARLGCVVALAGPGLRGDQVIRRQAELIMAARGASPELAAAQRELLGRLHAVVLSGAAAPEKRRRLRAILRRHLELRGPRDPERLAALIEPRVESLLSPWWSFFLAYDPAAALRRLRCPVLALVGSKDLQVEPGQSFGPVLRRLSEGRLPQLEARVMPSLNHLFQGCRSGLPEEYGRIQETVSPRVLEALRSFLTDVLCRRRGRWY